MKTKLVYGVVILLLLLSACTSSAISEETPAADDQIVENPEVEEPEEVEVEEPVEEVVFRAAFMTTGPVADGGWNLAHFQGSQYLAENVPGVEVSFQESVKATADMERLMRQFARDGYDVVFGAGFGFMEPTIKVAGEFPDTIFENCSGFKTAENAGNYFASMEEARYLSGMAAGLMTESNIIGYVAAHPIPEVVRGINSFSLGVKAANPDARVHVIWTNAWYDPGTERIAAESLLALGADVMAQHQNGTATLEAAKEAGVYSIGYGEDMNWVDPDTVITSPMFNWGPYYVYKVQQIMDGEWISESYYGTMADGMITLAPWGNDVPQEVRDAVEEVQAQMTAAEFGHGSIELFSGPLNDNEGNLQVPEGTTMTLDDLLSWQWFVDNVVGRVGE